MSLVSNLWCKLWNFVLTVFTTVVEGIGFALKTAGTVLIDVVGGLASGVAEALGLSGVMPLLLLGGGAFLLMSLLSKDDKRREPSPVIIRTPPKTVYDGGVLNDQLNRK